MGSRSPAQAKDKEDVPLRGINQGERVVEKRRIRLIVFKPYRKPTQVDKRKYAKVNG